jgi:hypothetical protein
MIIRDPTLPYILRNRIQFLIKNLVIRQTLSLFKNVIRLLIVPLTEGNRHAVDLGLFVLPWFFPSSVGVVPPVFPSLSQYRGTILVPTLPLPILWLVCVFEEPSIRGQELGDPRASMKRLSFSPFVQPMHSNIRNTSPVAIVKIATVGTFQPRRTFNAAPVSGPDRDELFGYGRPESVEENLVLLVPPRSRKSALWERRIGKPGGSDVLRPTGQKFEAPLLRMIVINELEPPVFGIFTQLLLGPKSKRSTTIRATFIATFFSSSVIVGEPFTYIEYIIA